MKNVYDFLRFHLKRKLFPLTIFNIFSSYITTLTIQSNCSIRFTSWIFGNTFICTVIMTLNIVNRQTHCWLVRRIIEYSFRSIWKSRHKFYVYDYLSIGKNERNGMFEIANFNVFECIFDLSYFFCLLFNLLVFYRIMYHFVVFFWPIIQRNRMRFNETFQCDIITKRNSN